jgi:DNA repair protein RadA/Sms
MAKVKQPFSVKAGAQYAKWQGQCNSCKEWNTIKKLSKTRKKHGKANQRQQVKPRDHSG